MNGACDAEVDSFDGAILFTGRADELNDVGEGTKFQRNHLSSFVFRLKYGLCLYWSSLCHVR